MKLRCAGEVQGLLAEGVESFAVCLLHGYRNPVHEQRVRDIIRQLSGEVHVSISSEVAPEIREYERASTTVINAYVAPIVGPYLRALRQRLESLGIGSKLLIMQSNGGTATPDTAQRFPVRLLESGPSAGAIGAAYLARETKRPKVLFFDMGGTTAKAFIVDDGHPLIARKLEVAHVYRFKHGSGLPVQIPAIDMIEIGAGGGSIARIDRLGLLKVGPESAESDPGPACYGLGGTLPTVTDADLILGYLSADNFLGGRMRLDQEASRRAILDHIATPLGLSIEEAAWGIHHVVNENMASAARVHLLEHAKSPGDYSMVAFGGAGPVHAYGVARALRQSEVIVPWQAGVGSAYGMLCAPVSFDVARSLTVPIIDGAAGSDLAGALQVVGDVDTGGVRRTDVVADADRVHQYGTRNGFRVVARQRVAVVCRIAVAADRVPQHLYHFADEQLRAGHDERARVRVLAVADHVLDALRVRREVPGQVFDVARCSVGEDVLHHGVVVGDG